MNWDVASNKYWEDGVVESKGGKQKFSENAICYLMKLKALSFYLQSSLQT